MSLAKLIANDFDAAMHYCFSFANWNTNFLWITLQQKAKLTHCFISDIQNWVTGQHYKRKHRREREKQQEGVKRWQRWKTVFSPWYSKKWRRKRQEKEQRCKKRAFFYMSSWNNQKHDTWNTKHNFKWKWKVPQTMSLLTLPLKLINCLSVVCKIYLLNGMLM